MSDNIEDIRHHIIKRLTECVSELEAQIAEMRINQAQQQSFLTWMDHVNCTPTKAQRYEQLLNYIKKLSEFEDYEYPFHALSDKYDMPMPLELLKEIGEDK